MLLPLGVALFAARHRLGGDDAAQPRPGDRPVRADPGVADRAGRRDRLRAVHRHAIAPGAAAGPQRRGRHRHARSTRRAARCSSPASTVCIALLGMLVAAPLVPQRRRGLGDADGRHHDVRVAHAAALAARLPEVPRALSRRERRALRDHGPEPTVVAGGWQRWANFVSRHPRSLSAGALVAIVLICMPFFSLHLGSSDQGLEPALDHDAPGLRPAGDGLRSGIQRSAAGRRLDPQRRRTRRP